MNYLQYTLLLLILDYATGEFLDDIFTIHFATINTLRQMYVS